MKLSLQDAFNIFQLDPINKPDQDTIKAQYKALCKKHHPDVNPSTSDHMIKMINNAYDALKEYDSSKDFKSFQKESDLSEKYQKALELCLNLPDIITELCGTWIWLSGNTKTHKDVIKASKLFKWSPNKSMWYFRPDQYRSFNREKRDMAYIRSSYGSKVIKKSYQDKIEA